MVSKTGLIIAGSDTLSGGGLQTDIRTFETKRLNSCNILTCIATVNQSNETIAIHDLSPELIKKQWDDIKRLPIDVLKIGMLANLEIAVKVKKIMESCSGIPIVIDPVLALKESGYGMSDEIVAFFYRELLPIAFVTTPNLKEAEMLARMSINNKKDMEQAAIVIKASSVEYVVIKGGHRLPGTEATDLIYNGKTFNYLTTPKLQTTQTNGAGCTFASAIAANIANELPVIVAVTEAKQFVYQAIKNGFPLLSDLGNVWVKL
ncbi:hydroxymethylpyrimidine/phosphomethylpyrimidine kinase [Vagococcus vulneris]|uniref:pyridoxal kinase n=1 Tax=Vagococcus vulneris TaxID=1977869 RepID=A0A429ZXU9_9ENTE|nr:hydroxymethylpyrimidine/phosphomethylpyrimidine kinase [Vagococcus vulneris]RST98732.1 hypothetical protein CBF37_06695 [Vagococcus vulneris]